MSTQAADAPLTPAERQLALLLWFWTGAFAVVGTIFLVAPAQTVAGLNVAAQALGLAPVPLLAEKFWLVLAVSMMATITALSYLGARDIRHGLGYVPPLMISKSTTVLGFLLMAVLEGTGGYVLGSVVDFLVLAPTFVLYQRAKASRTN